MKEFGFFGLWSIPKVSHKTIQETFPKGPSTVRVVCE